MGISWNTDVPIVALYNNLEVFHDFLDRTTDSDVVHTRFYRGDRALLWLGMDKLVVASAPVQHLGYLQRQLGYHDTRYEMPQQPSEWLSLDVIREKWLLERVAAHAGRAGALQLVAYATTPQLYQLADALRTEHQIKVMMPESPSPENLWIRDYIDTKSGFRTLASQWLDGSAARIPFGIVCTSLREAAGAVSWFLRNGQQCIAKADTGEGSLGNKVFCPNDRPTMRDIEKALDEDTFLHDDLVVIEQFIHASNELSPSLEFFVPADGMGEPSMTYLANQLFEKSGGFGGVLISQDLMRASWFPAFRESGLEIARKLQKMGYAGHFDMDAVIDDQDNVYLLEVNARRTGGTHTHEFARFRLGEDYLKNVTLISQNKMHSGSITRFEELDALVGDLHYPIDGEQRGIVITITSALDVSQFGCIMIADSAEEALSLQQQLAERIRSAERAVR